MEKISRIDPTGANEQVQGLFREAQDRLGMIPNSLKVMANSPAMLKMALEVEEALNQGMLSPRIREQIALAVSEINGSRYCIAAHSALGGIKGLSEEEIADARKAASPDRRTEAALAFARELVVKRGAIDEVRIVQMQQVGWQNGEIVEIIVHTAMTTLFNYLNRAAGTESDFPEPAA
jgi:uncharacterized peroxidase-related enzyme